VWRKDKTKKVTEAAVGRGGNSAKSTKGQAHGEGDQKERDYQGLDEDNGGTIGSRRTRLGTLHPPYTE